MRNYELVHQWANTVNMDKAFDEMIKLKRKHPWLQCEETLKFFSRLSNDLPKVVEIIKQQEKQNAMHREFVRVSQIADEAIYHAVEAMYLKK